MTKPIGPLCNLNCEYCFYLSKELLYPDEPRWRMTEALLEEYVRQYMEAQPGPVVSFAWQGGEPTLVGLPFFRRVVALQRAYTPPGKTVENALQTNGMLLDDDWCAFLKEHNFLVGLSLDGPADFHDRYRLDKGGNPTSTQALAAMRRLQRYGLRFNVLCVVNRLNAREPERVYRFFKELGVEHIQFIPLVEKTENERLVTDRSVLPEDFGQFLITIFDEWIRHDVGDVFIQTFEQAAAIWVGVGASLCLFQQRCGRNLMVEHNGDVYACDHYAEQRYRLGNIALAPLAELVDSPEQQAFGNDKWETLPLYCRNCRFLFACNGECPKNRIAVTPDGEPGLNYLCTGYKAFFSHIDPYMRRLADILRTGRPATFISAQLNSEEAARFAAAGRNDPCPCGSTRKYKYCCLPKRTPNGRQSVPGP